MNILNQTRKLIPMKTFIRLLFASTILSVLHVFGLVSAHSSATIGALICQKNMQQHDTIRTVGVVYISDDELENPWKTVLEFHALSYNASVEKIYVIVDHKTCCTAPKIQYTQFIAQAMKALRSVKPVELCITNTCGQCDYYWTKNSDRTIYITPKVATRSDIIAEALYRFNIDVSSTRVLSVNTIQYEYDLTAPW